MKRMLLLLTLASCFPRPAAAQASVASDAQFFSALRAVRAEALQERPAVSAVWKRFTWKKSYNYALTVRDSSGKTITVKSALEICRDRKELLTDVLNSLEARRVSFTCVNYGNLAEFYGSVEVLIESAARR